MLLPPGTTECNHSHYTGNSFSAPHSGQQLQNGTIATSVQPLAYTEEANGAGSSGFVSSPLVPRSAFSSQVPACPTRNVIGDVMPLAEATKLSFLEFLQRCGIPIAPPQPPQLPVPISLVDAEAQTTPPSDASQDVSTQTSEQQVSSIFFDVAVQTSSHGIHTSSLDAAVQTIPHSTLSQHVSQQGFSLNFLVFYWYVCSDSHTQYGATRCCHTTTDHGVLYWMYLLERSSGPPKLCSSVPVISTRRYC